MTFEEWEKIAQYADLAGGMNAHNMYTDWADERDKLIDRLERAAERERTFYQNSQILLEREAKLIEALEWIANNIDYRDYGHDFAVAVGAAEKKLVLP